MDRNMVEAPDVHFINVEIEPLKSYIIKSLLDKEVVWFGADVRRECDRELGVMALKLLDYEALFNIELPKTKEERILYRDSVPTHAMVFTGVDLREGKPRTWCVENSWGSERGKEGYYTLYDSWFDEYVYEAVIRRKYLPGELLALLDTDPTILAEDDAMR
jgi:bleomycin hydrolase